MKQPNASPYTGFASDHMKRTELKRKAPLRSKSQLKTKAPLKSGTTRLKARSTSKNHKQPAHSKIRQSAEGQQCQVRVPGICNGDPTTVVLAHLNGAGAGTKAHDIHGAFSCSACHSWLDGGFAQAGHNRDTRDLWHLQGVIRTQYILLEKGLIRTAQHDTKGKGEC